METPVRWIRGPISDFVWFFSGLPLGVIFAARVVPFPVIIYIFVVINTAHLFAPMAMAWSHRGFRPHMLRQKTRFIAIPVALTVAGLLLGCLSWICGSDIRINPLTLAAGFRGMDDFFHTPLALILATYFVWNIYHFGMQNYGLLRLLRPTIDKTAAMQVAMFVTVILMVVLPDKFRMEQLSLFMMGAVLYNHQLAAIGLAAHVWANHHHRSQLFFVTPLLTVGAGAAYGFYLLPPGLLLMLVIGVRATVGFGHFLYDRWVWKLSDPTVRATIGADLLAARPQMIEPFPAIAGR